MARAFEHLCRADLDVPFLVLPNPDATVHRLRECFLARNADPGLLGHAEFGRDTVPLSFEEVL
ncbi:MAG TPA: hypothetical protein VEY95_01130 [Azospirillaceae bacterium]|nr:hypothetical protein [Azospirillaceae bacterium]